MKNLLSLREGWLRPILFYGNNRVSLFGGAVTTASAMVLIGFWIISIFGHGGSLNPYLGIILNLCLPAVFVAGLLLIPIGVVIKRAYLRARGQVPSAYPEISLSDPMFRRGIDFVVVVTLVNFVVVGTASYRGVAAMDTVSFCGATCHVMNPEHTAYRVSAHAGVACTDCHVASGAAGYVDAKFNGTKQLFMVLTHSYPRPIMAEGKVPLPSTTCLNCHNPQNLFGDKLQVTSSYADDEANTKTSNVIVMHVGGRDAFGHLSGIHGAHLGKIEYVATNITGQTIPWVGKTNDDGSVTEFVTPGAKQPNSGQRRRMDCIDCHNRAAHSFDTPEDALNKDMVQGSPNTSLPFVHKEGLLLIKADYSSKEVATKQITEKFITFYRSQYPAIWNAQQAQVNQAAKTLVAIYGNNVFPAMDVRWGTHPNDIGHTTSPGCFRCHDGNHIAKNTTSITNDCSACHNLVATDESHPKLLTELGVQ
jgi:nitrate/TMAO reductase-like tetraheme cytochrome c subunit